MSRSCGHVLTLLSIKRRKHNKLNINNCGGANPSPGDATRGDYRPGGAGAVRQNVQAEAHQARYVLTNPALSLVGKRFGGFSD
jgi:hypothetical protein